MSSVLFVLYSMSKTTTPELSPDVLHRLQDYADLFRDQFPWPRQARWSSVYLQGLLLDGERKSIEPMAQRVTLPPDLQVKDPEQALQQFLNQSPWDEQKVLRPYRQHLAGTFASPQGVFVIDDTSFPKQGKLSVGVRVYARAWDIWRLWGRVTHLPSVVRLAGNRTSFVPSMARL